MEGAACFSSRDKVLWYCRDGGARAHSEKIPALPQIPCLAPAFSNHILHCITITILLLVAAAANTCG